MYDISSPFMVFPTSTHSHKYCIRVRFPASFAIIPYPSVNSRLSNLRNSQLHDSMLSPTSTETHPLHSGTRLSPIEEVDPSDYFVLSPTCDSYASSDEDCTIETTEEGLRLRLQVLGAESGGTLKRKDTFSQSLRSQYDPNKHSNNPATGLAPCSMVPGSKGHQFVWSKRFYDPYVAG